jgi:hypothetical protein
MKKIIIVFLVGVVVGVIVGVNIGIHAPKWVSEDYGMYIIHTEFMGNVYDDIADKESEHVNNAHAYTISWR